VTQFLRSEGGTGTRAVISRHEDTATKGVEAARLALSGAPGGALTHDLGGYPGEMVSFLSVVGTELG
jgi:acetyl-CoA C-acetyltransferase